MTALTAPTADPTPSTPRFDAGAYPRSYGPARSRRLLALAGVMAPVLLLVVSLAAVPRVASSPWRVPLALALLPFHSFLGLGVMRTRVVLHADRIEQMLVLGSRILRLEDIESGRLVPSSRGSGTMLVLRPRPGRGVQMRIALGFALDDAWRAWFDRVPSAG